MTRKALTTAFAVFVIVVAIGSAYFWSRRDSGHRPGHVTPAEASTPAAKTQ